MENANNPAHTKAHPDSALRSWLIIALICLGTITWGLILHLGIGDKGPPVWDYRIVGDIPGESAYSTASPKQFPGLVPHPLGGGGQTVAPQHVMGEHRGPAIEQQEGGR